MALDSPADPVLPPLGARAGPIRIEMALAFDDVLLVPAYSRVLPSADRHPTRLTRTIGLNIPLISSAMDTVTEAAWRSRWRRAAASG